MKQIIKRQQFLVLLTTIIGSSVVMLDGTIVTLALPKIASQLQVGFSSLQWITDGYLLSLSALILLGGSLGDIFGRKKVYLVGIAGFGAASLICALAPNAPVLIITRVLQGLFGAMVVPGALAILNTNFPSASRGRAIGQWTAWGSVATVAGPLVGGSILDITSWRYIFVINIPLVVVCFILGMLSIEDTQALVPRRIDFGGAFLAAAGLAGLTFGLIEGPESHWQLLPIASIIVGGLLLVGFLLQESRTSDPMVRLSLFKSRNFTGANLMTFAMYGALSGFTFSLVIFLQTHIHYSSISAGFSLLPVSILMFLGAGRIGRLSARYGPRRFMTAGPIIAAIGIFLLYRLHSGDSYVGAILPSAILFAIGLVLTVAPLNATLMASVEQTSSGIASGVNNAISRTAGLLVIAVLGLFGSSQVYHFAIILCGLLAVISGLTSFLLIRPRRVQVNRSPPPAIHAHSST